MNRIYCHGELVETHVRDGWVFCSGCGHQMWRADQTFALSADGLSSAHGNQDETQERAPEAEDSVDAGGAVQA